MYTITIHCQADDLSLLEPIAKHLGHIEVAIDAPTLPEPFAQAPAHHPVIDAVEEAKRELEAQRKQAFVSERDAKREREAARKRTERARWVRESPGVIGAVACPTCEARVGQPCHGPSGISFGMTGHTHLTRRQYAARAK